MPTKVFWTEPTDQVELALRRYRHSGSGNDCPGKYGYHNAQVSMGRFLVKYTEDKYLASRDDEFSKTDSRWPTKCEYCDYKFEEADPKQVFQERIYKRVDNGQELTTRDRVPGMMWDAWWMGSYSKGLDGIHLVVILPNGNEWMVDSRANNCDKPDDVEHKCWVRHGDPKTGNIHVDKNGLTCGAGAGSIMSGNYHGFLHDGYLTDG